MLEAEFGILKEEIAAKGDEEEEEEIEFVDGMDLGDGLAP